MRLNDCTPGDIVVVTWKDLGTMLDGTDQIVQYFGAMHSPRGARKRRDQAAAESSIVELIDPDTLLPYPRGVVHELNMYVVENLEVLDVVERSKHARLDDEAERLVSKQRDEDPLLGRRADNNDLMKG